MIWHKFKFHWKITWSGAVIFRSYSFTFTFTHLADAFIQSDLQCIQAIHLYCQYVLSAANAMLYHWATGTLIHKSVENYMGQMSFWIDLDLQFVSFYKSNYIADNK